MDYPSSQKTDVPTLEQLYNSLEEDFDIFSEDLKHQILAGVVRQNVVYGNNDILINSPKAKTLKALVKFSNDTLLEEERIPKRCFKTCC
jgi:hypothetical protein